MRWPVRGVALVVLTSCGKTEPAPASPVEAVSVAPQTTGSPNEPTLLLGSAKPIDIGDVEHVKVKEEQPDAAWKPPKERCPEGIRELMSVHVPLGQTMALDPGATPVSALGTSADVADVTFDRGKKIVQVTARKYGLVYVTVVRERDGVRSCTLYGVNTGY